MKYQGSKNRHAKFILPLVLEGRSEDQYYVEPFVGGANLIDKVEGKRIGSDSNKYLIALLQAASEGWLPEESYTEDQYKYVKSNKDEDLVLTGYFGFALSYGGKFFGGWRRDKTGKRDYPGEAYRNAIKQFPNLVGCNFLCCDYKSLDIPDGSIIYCDPPYQSTTGYKDSIDHDKFFDWCRDKSEEGHSVFISEYSAPNDFEVIWEKKVNNSLTKDTGSKKGVERLYKVS